MIGAEGYEMLFVVPLKVRKLSTVESLRHRIARNMWGQPHSAVRGAKVRYVEVYWELWEKWDRWSG